MKLLSPKTQDSRPILDRVKESLFSMLYKYDLPDGKRVADLFSGVGSIGLEALSRGAEFVLFVEAEPKVIAILKRNIEKAGFVKESKIIRADAFKIGARYSILVRHPRGGQDTRPPSAWRTRYQMLVKTEKRETRNENPESRIELVFVDPPYAHTKDVGADSPLSGLLTLLGEQVAPDGIVVVRTHRRTFLLEQYGQFQIIERRQWGTMAVTILEKQKLATKARSHKEK